jgi:cell division protein ZapE
VSSERLESIEGGAVSSAYSRLVAAGSVHADAAQQQAAILLDRIAADLMAPAAPSGLLGLFAKRHRRVDGAYIHGQVGRGKTMLMDLFYDQVAIHEKRRIHFHAFMDEMHAGITAFRRSERGSGNTDPIAAVAEPIGKSLRLLCLDEFHVTDITNAMLLQRLFTRLFENGVTLVATSNVTPRRLYENGLNRQLFLPFIDLLERHVTVFALDAREDYRREKFVGQQVYAFGTGPEVDAAMDQLWARMTGGQPGEPTSVESIGRRIPVPRAAMGAARFDFAGLCEVPLGSRDFVRIAHAFDAVVIDHVPMFTRLNSNAAKRFILLIDSLYDRGVKLGASFAVPLAELGGDDQTAFEFERTVSRLMEMRSEAYLAQGLRDPAPAA